MHRTLRRLLHSTTIDRSATLSSKQQPQLISKRRQRKSSALQDYIEVQVQGGTGASGLAKYNGRGGDGGHVRIVADAQAHASTSLNVTKNAIDQRSRQLRQSVVRAGRGWPSRKTAILGLPGKDETIPVPLGVEIRDADTGESIAGVINTLEDDIIVARGGAGGSRWSQYLGVSGERRRLRIDFKLLADVGFVGYPNAGKSTLLSTISAATPRIAAYPFTTLRPELGVVEYSDYRQITFADLPGLVEGAHQAVGLGHEFLRHVERTRLLLFVVDVFGFRSGPKSPLRTPFDTVVLLNRELELYKPDLVDKPCAICLNKMDRRGADAAADRFRSSWEHYDEHIRHFPEELRPERPIVVSEIFQLSALNRDGHDVLTSGIRRIIDEDERARSQPATDAATSTVQVYQPSIATQLL